MHITISVRILQKILTISATFGPTKRPLFGSSLSNWLIIDYKPKINVKLGQNFSVSWTYRD